VGVNCAAGVDGTGAATNGRNSDTEIRFVGSNVPLIRLIAAAWGFPLQTQRLTLARGVRMPDEIYDIEATPETGAIPPGMTTDERVRRMRLMLQALLEDGFRLKVRREQN
jgi:uncharacterized protein (TIGR03435 family)